MTTDLINTDIIINNRKITKYSHEGEIFVEGREGTEYSIQIKNNNFVDKIKVIVSVDGVSIFDGKEAGKESKGFSINPGEIINIPGWFLSTNLARNFKFSSVKKAFAENKTNVGVIGFMVFKEKKIFNTVKLDKFGNPFNTTTPIYRTNIYGSNALVSTSNVGTTYGEKTNVNLREVEDNFEENYSQIKAIYYDDAKGLEKRGIKLNYYDDRPNPFPETLTRNKFCKIPME